MKTWIIVGVVLLFLMSSPAKKSKATGRPIMPPPANFGSAAASVVQASAPAIGKFLSGLVNDSSGASFADESALYQPGESIDEYTTGLFGADNAFSQ